jgi:hypothetical protein
MVPAVKFASSGFVAKMPCNFRSSGRYPMPSLIASAGSRGAIGRPCSAIVPRSGRNAPNAASATALRPDPTSPYIPVTWPAGTSQSTF